MKYSLIIPVYNRLEEVKELLSSAEQLSFNRTAFEILFVDDGSKDGFKEYIEKYSSDSGIEINTIYQQNKGPGAARNLGMSIAKGQYFIFIDSDCLFPENYLQAVDEALNEQSYDAFGGPDGSHPDFSSLLKAINYSMTSFIGTGGTRGGKKQVGRYYPRSFNMGIRREVFERIGGMNALRHGQDMDYSARIYQAGFSVGFIYPAKVYHKRRTSISKFFRQIFNWGVARINLGRTHPELLKPVHLLPAILVIGYVLVLFLGIILPSLRWLLMLMLLGHSLVCFWAVFESWVQYKNIKVSLLSILTLNIQVFAYGAGFIWARVQTFLGKPEATGFVKNYYGKRNSKKAN